jgi:hypothetical protein
VAAAEPHPENGIPVTSPSHALAYAERGWPVFPCRPDNPACTKPKCHECKAPLTPHGFEDATTDPAVISTWWRRWPTANVAVVTGTPGPDVLDVDRKPDGNGFAAFNRLKRAGMLTGAAMLVRTRSGGVHLYFTGTSQRKGALPRHRLDFQACGGYVIAPPSSVHGQAYEVIDSRPATATFNWDAAKQLLNPPVTDRSAALYRLIGACVYAGLDDGAIHRITAGYQPALEKYGRRLDAEVERCLRKIGAA